MSSPTLLPVNIFEGQDFYVPAYRIVVNAQELEIESDVISVTYTDSLTNVDSFEMVVNNWDPDGIPGSPARTSSSRSWLCWWQRRSGASWWPTCWWRNSRCRGRSR